MPSFYCFAKQIMTPDSIKAFKPSNFMYIVSNPAILCIQFLYYFSMREPGFPIAPKIIYCFLYCMLYFTLIGWFV